MDNHIPGHKQGSEGLNNLYFVPNGDLSQPPQLHNAFFGNDAWAYHLAASLRHLETHKQSEGSGTEKDGVNLEMNMDNQTHGEEILGNQSNDVISASSKGKKAAQPKNLARRGGGFTKAEDKVICSAWLNISKDPITGVNQSGGGFYNRIHAYFNENKPEGSSRSQIAIRNRWGLIQKAVNKFCSCKSTIDRRNESGKNEQDRIDDAVKMYEQTEPFMFMHCWKLLRNEPKWNDRLLELNTSSAAVRPPESSQV